MTYSVIADFLEGSVGKFLVLKFELLDPYDIGLSVREPGANKFQASTQAVDVPSGNFHWSAPDRNRYDCWQIEEFVRLRFFVFY